MALNRNPAWISDLEDRETFISFADDPKIGLYGLFGNDWHTLGIETDDGNWSLSRELTESTTNGAGYGVVSRSHKPGNLSATIDALEENEVVDYIKWPDTLSSNDGQVYGRRHSSKVARAHVARVHVKNKGSVEISVTRVKAYLTAPERARGDAAAGTTINIGYEPDADKIVFEDRFFRINEGGEVVEFTPKRFVPDAEITGDVEEGTARKIGAPGGSELEFELVNDNPDAVTEGTENP